MRLHQLALPLQRQRRVAGNAGFHQRGAIRGKAQGQRHGHAGQRLIRARGLGTTIVVDVPEQRVTNRAVGNQTKIDGHVVLTLLQNRPGFRAIGIYGSIIARLLHGLGVASRDSEGQAIGAGQQVREDVLAVGIRGHGA